MRVILADDAPLVRTGIARLLEDAGFEVVAQLDATPSISRLLIRAWAPVSFMALLAFDRGTGGKLERPPGGEVVAHAEEVGAR